MNTTNHANSFYMPQVHDDLSRQVRSIGDQLAELHELARHDNIAIVEEFIERQTAKKPGRPIFNEMLERLERGQADGILAWHPDRLSPTVWTQEDHLAHRHGRHQDAPVSDILVRAERSWKILAVADALAIEVLHRQPVGEHPPWSAAEGEKRNLAVGRSRRIPQRPAGKDDLP